MEAQTLFCSLLRKLTPPSSQAHNQAAAQSPLKSFPQAKCSIPDAFSTSVTPQNLRASYSPLNLVILIFSRKVIRIVRKQEIQIKDDPNQV